MLVEDEKVFACEERFIRELEKLLQENVKLLTKGRKVGKKSYRRAESVLLWRNVFTRRRKKFTRVCQVLLEDEQVFAREESFIRRLEKLSQETINC